MAGAGWVGIGMEGVLAGIGGYCWGQASSSMAVVLSSSAWGYMWGYLLGGFTHGCGVVGWLLSRALGAAGCIKNI